MEISISLKEMAKNAVHFGHPTQRWNPKMRPYLYGERNGIHIFDLKKTAEHLVRALQYLNELASRHQVILFVGTKQQGRKILEEIHEEADMPVVINKWMPGLLTNFRTLKQRIDYFVLTKEAERTGGLEKFTKKEQSVIKKELVSLEGAFAGVQDMTKVPDAIFVTDVVRDKIAVQEARRLGIPVIGIVDSNADPDSVDYVIPANDDALKSVSYILKLAKSALLGKHEKKKEEPIEE